MSSSETVMERKYLVAGKKKATLLERSDRVIDYAMRTIIILITIMGLVYPLARPQTSATVTPQTPILIIVRKNQDTSCTDGMKPGRMASDISGSTDVMAWSGKNPKMMGLKKSVPINRPNLAPSRGPRFA